MPAPINRAKAAKSKARKAKAASGASSQAYVNDIDDADGWTPVVTILCSAFKLPDLNTRRGLKRIHSDFDTIYERLDKEYQKNSTNERVCGGIVAIFSKICHDAVLRNKLFERGILDKLLPLLDLDSTRHMALRALTNITHHGGVHIRSTIASHAHVLTSLVAKFPDDPMICDLSVSVLSHTVLSCTEGPEDEPAFPEILEKLDMVKILNTGVHCMTQPFSNGSCVEHGTNLLASSALHGHYAYKGAPEAVKILVAGMRSPDWGLRSMALGGLQRLHKPGSEEDIHRMDPNALMALKERIPPHVNDVLMAYGPTRCELFCRMRAMSEYMKAMTSFPEDRNLYSLGLKLSKNILSTEFSIWDGFFEVDDPRTGWKADNLGLPFNRWTDCLPLCAKALREKGLEADRDAANVLDIKFMILRGRTDDAADLGREGLKKNPSFAYYYYAISLAADRTNGLRASKQGMKCKDITPFVKFQLMQRAVDHAAELGLETLQFCPAVGDAKWELGTSLLRSAVEDARGFMEEAPPDNRYMKWVVYWYSLLTILISGDISLDLREIKFAQGRLKIAEDVAKLLKAGPPNTMLRRTYQTVISLYRESVEKYEEIFKRQAAEREVPAISPPSDKKAIEDDLSTWLDNLQLEEGEVPEDDEHHGGHDHCHRRDMNRHIHELAYTKDPTDRSAFYRCSYCGNPSAGLKKCSGCEKARYCDGSCQKADWKEHKRICKS